MTKNHVTLLGYDNVDLELNGRQISALVGYDAIEIEQGAPPDRKHQKNPIGFNIGNSHAPMAQEIKRFDRKSYIGNFGSNGIFVGYGGQMTIRIMNPISEDVALDQLMGMEGFSKLRELAISASADGKQRLEQEHRRKQRQIEDAAWFADVVERVERGEPFIWSGLITDKAAEKTITMTGGRLVDYPVLMGLNNDPYADFTFCTPSFDL